MIPKKRRGGIRATFFDPLGTARVAKRLSNFVTMTRAHLKAIPDGASQTELNERANAWASQLLPAMGVDLRVQGSEHAEEAHAQGGALLVSNHRSYLDILALLASTPSCFLAKDDVADWPVLGEAAVRVGTVFVERDRKNSRRAAREALARLLGESHVVSVFPEGTTYRGPGCREFRPGAFVTTSNAGCPILPVAIEYPSIADAWQDESIVTHFNGKFRQPRIDAHVRIGPLMRNDDPIALRDQAQEWVNDTLHTIWNEVGSR
jgi:1-acyl-sn-glycerol-3-phosphate acyltransferase